MFSDEELINDLDLLHAEAQYQDGLDEEDLGFPFRYAAQKQQVVYLREGERE
jgi:hypothetical protein